MQRDVVVAEQLVFEERRTGGEHGWMREEGLAANRDGNFSAAVVA
jgi:hypothetical protein